MVSEATENGPESTTPEALVLLMRQASRALQQLLTAKSIENGLSPLEFAVLTRAADAGGVALKDVGRVIGLRTSSMTELADRLEARKLVQRVRIQSDRRVVVLQATASGRRIIDDALAPIHAQTAAIVSTLDQAELQRFASVLGQMSSAMIATAEGSPTGSSGRPGRRVSSPSSPQRPADV